MIFTKLAIKNIFCFSDTEIDLTIKRRPIEKNGTWNMGHFRWYKQIYIQKIYYYAWSKLFR